MDPNETLKRLREISEELYTWRSMDEGDELSRADFELINETRELIVALDEWLSRGGFLPTAWAESADSNPYQGGGR